MTGVQTCALPIYEGPAIPHPEKDMLLAQEKVKDFAKKIYDMKNDAGKFDEVYHAAGFAKEDGIKTAADFQALTKGLTGELAKEAKDLQSTVEAAVTKPAPRPKKGLQLSKAEMSSEQEAKIKAFVDRKISAGESTEEIKNVLKDYGVSDEKISEMLGEKPEAEAKSYEGTVKQANLSDAQIEKWKQDNKAKLRKERVPTVQESAEKLKKGEITNKQYLDIVRKEQPIKAYDKVPALPSDLAVIASLDKNKVATGIIGVTKDFKEGTRVSETAWPNISQQGQTVFRWAVFEMAPIGLKAIAAAGLNPDQLAAFIPHQANERIIDSLAKSMKLPESVLIARDIRTTGNTSAASIPLAMDALLSENPILHSKPALLIGFGAGLVYAGQVVELPPKEK